MVTLKIYWCYDCWNSNWKFAGYVKSLRHFPPIFPELRLAFLSCFLLNCSGFLAVLSLFLLRHFAAWNVPHTHTHTDTAVGLPFSPAAPRWRLPPSHTSWHLRCRCRQRQRRRVSLFLQSRGVRCISFSRGLRLSCVMTFKRQSEATTATTTITATRINAATQ